jgi:mannose-1-phosphate guanylyltransferase/mannose-6-phosphate isomerase
MSIDIKPVILCGGFCTRLWPLTREPFPKKFVPLISGKSLLGLTIERVKKLGFPGCITNEDHRFFDQESLKDASNSLDASILLEPVGRNTAAAMASAALMPGVADSDLEMIEVQSGSYLGEDDIVRFEDVYGRNNP